MATGVNSQASSIPFGAVANKVRLGHRALFIPDIDQWSKWDRDIRKVVDGVDLAFLDGTFASPDELPGRSIADIPHPLIPATRDLLKGTAGRVWFIHLNHTNRELGAADVVRDGMSFEFDGRLAR